MQPGQQSIRTFFKKITQQTKAETCKEREENVSDHKESDIVTSEEGRKKLVVLGNDVIGLFPAMKEANTGRAVGNQVFKSPLIVRGLDYKEVVRYVAGCRKLCGDLSEVENVLPWRRKSGKGGRHPGMQSKEMKGKVRGLEDVWEFPTAKPTPYQQRILRARMAEIGVRILWTNMMYEFGGETFLQMEGGPIGSRVTMAASRLVMQEWSEGYLDILERS